MAHGDPSAAGPGPGSSSAGLMDVGGGASNNSGGAPFRLLHTLKGHERAVSYVSFNPASDTLLASCSADTTLQLWDTRAGTNASPAARMAHSQGVNACAWHPDGRYIATASDDLTAKIWDAESGRCLRTLQGHTNYVFCLMFDPVAGHVLVTGSFDETIRFWDVRSGKVLREIPAHSDPVTAVDFHYDGTVLASASFDGLVRVWDTSNGHCLRTLAADRDSTPASAVVFSPNGQYLLQATLNSTARLMNVERGKMAKSYTGHKAANYCSTMSFVEHVPGGPYIAGGSEDGDVLLWHVNSKQVVQRIPGRANTSTEGPGHCDAVLCTTSHKHAPLLATCAHENDRTVKVWTAAPPG